jgi:RNA recognition motif-containing protein
MGMGGGAAFNGGVFPAATNGAPASAGPTNRVYVGNLPWQTSWQDLKDHMRKAGNVTRADVFIDETGRSKGCGIVEYSTPEEAQTAIKTLNDTKIDETERLIFVREDREERAFTPAAAPRGGGLGRGIPRGRGGFNPHFSMGRGGFVPPAPSARGRQVFIGNLPYTTSWQDLKDRFRQAGNIIRADVLLDTTGRSKGQGTVLFESPGDAQKAIRMFDNTDFQQRIITVHEDKFAQ